MAAVLFEEDGRIRTLHRLRTDGTFLLRLDKETYHFYMPLTESVIYYESKLGPYCQEDNLFAPWAPARSDREGAAAFKRQLWERIQAEAGLKTGPAHGDAR
jgi:hypothetical protein